MRARNATSSQRRASPVRCAMATISSRRNRPPPMTMAGESDRFDGVIGHLIPEGIEIEPVEWRFAQPVFQPRNETAGVRGHRTGATRAWQVNLIGEFVDARAVTVAVMQASQQVHRATQ